MGVWERRYYRVLNAWMRFLLRSPLHRLRSGRLVLLEFAGRRSGRRYALPVSYWQPDPEIVVCLSSATWSRWWANLGRAEVRVLLRGRWRAGRSALVDDQAERRALVTGFLRKNARDARHYGVATDAGGVPDAPGLEELAAAATTKVIEIKLTD